MGSDRFPEECFSGCRLFWRMQDNQVAGLLPREAVLKKVVHDCRASPWKPVIQMREQPAPFSEIHVSSVWALHTVKGDSVPPDSLPHAFSRVSGNPLTITEHREASFAIIRLALQWGVWRSVPQRAHRQRMQRRKSWIIEWPRTLWSWHQLL